MKASFAIIAATASLIAIGSNGFPQRPARPGEPNHVPPSTALNEASGYQSSSNQHVSAAGSPDTSVYDSVHSQSDSAHLRIRRDANDVLTDTAHIPSRPSNRSPRSGSTHSNTYDHHRIRRGPQEPFDTTVTRMERVARVINGIALQQGLTNGTIPTDTLISELLNLGSVTPAQIKDFNADGLKQLVKDIQELPAKLKEVAEIKTIEDKLKLIYTIEKESNGVMKLEKPSDDFKTAVDTLKGTTFDWKGVEGLVKNHETFIESIEKISLNPDVNGLSSALVLVRNALINLENTKFTSYETELRSKAFLQAKTTFAQFLTFQKSVQEYSSNEAKVMFASGTDPAVSIMLGNQIKGLSNVIKSVKTNLPIAQLLVDLFIPRHRHGNRQLLHSSGFPNGYSDLDLVFGDLKDPWVKEAIVNQTDALVKALDPLRAVAKSSSLFDEAILSKGEETLDAVKDIYLKIEMFSKQDHQFDAVASKLLDILRIPASGLIPENNGAYKTLQENIDALLKKVSAINEITSVTTTMMAEKKTSFESLKNTVVELAASTALTEADVIRMRESAEYKEIVGIIVPLKESVETLTGTISISTEIQYVSDHYSEVATFVDGSTKFTDLLTSLHNIPELKLVPEVIEAVHSQRSISIKSFDPVATSLGKVKSTLAGLQKSIGDVKTHTSDVNSKLMNMTNVEKDSIIIGSATRVMKSIKKASEKTLTLDSAKVQVVSDELAKLPDPEDQKNAKTLTDLATKLDTFNKQVKAAKDSEKASESTNLTSLDFSTGKTVTGIDLDFAAIGRSVDKLNPSKEAQEIKTVLDSLDSLGLDFAKHHAKIDASKDSLGAMDMFFAKFQKSLAPPAQPTASPQGSNRAGTKTVTVVVKEEDGFVVWVKSNWMIELGVTLLLVGAVIGLIFFLCYWKNRRKPYKLNRFIYSRFMGNVHFKTRSLTYRKLGMQYSDSIGIAIHTIGLWAQDSAESKDDEISKSVKGTKAWHNGTEIPLCEHGRLLIKMKGDGPAYYHGNVIPIGNKIKLAACQSPTVGSKDPPIHNNQAQFWTAVQEQKSKLVLYLGKPGEKPENLFFPTELNKTGTFGGKKEVTIKCIKIEELKEVAYKRPKRKMPEPESKPTTPAPTESKATTSAPPEDKPKTQEVDHEATVKILTLSVKIKGKSSFKLRLVHVDIWPDIGLPSEATCNVLVTLFDMVYMSKSPVFVCCENGVGKTGVFALALMNRQQLLDLHGKGTEGSTLVSIRHYRTNAVENAKQYLLALVLMIMDAIKKVDGKAEDEENEEKRNNIKGVEDAVGELLAYAEELDQGMEWCKAEEIRLIKKQGVDEEAARIAAEQAANAPPVQPNQDAKTPASTVDPPAPDAKTTASTVDPATFDEPKTAIPPLLNTLPPGRPAFTMTAEVFTEEVRKKELIKCQEQMKEDEANALLVAKKKKPKKKKKKGKKPSADDGATVCDETVDGGGDTVDNGGQTVCQEEDELLGGKKKDTESKPSDVDAMKVEIPYQEIPYKPNSKFPPHNMRDILKVG